MIEINNIAVKEIQKQYCKNDNPWYLGYSGGKDSTALIKLVYIALTRVKKLQKPITIIYCDTGVEIPIVRDLAITTINNIIEESKKDGLPLFSNIVQPNIEDRFFVKVIGKGYPTPTNKFRWCTRRLRIDPIKEVTSRIQTKGLVLLGIRKGESNVRDRTILKYQSETRYILDQSDNANVKIFSPIINFTLEDVWATIMFNPIPSSINIKELIEIYRNAEGECPIIRDPKALPCGKGRFGCWTCTVIKNDHAIEGMIEKGYHNLTPLYQYRNWMVQIRDNPKLRCAYRRNGQLSPGPFTLEARKEMLQRLILAQEECKFSLISTEEIDLIKNLWEMDKKSKNYRER